MKKSILALICCTLALIIAGFGLGNIVNEILNQPNASELTIVISILAVPSGCILWLAGRSYN